MEITIGKIVSWFFGILLLLAGLGSTTTSFATAVIWSATGLFLIPQVREKLNKEFDLQFSRWVVVLIAVVGMGLGSTFVDSGEIETQNTNKNLDSPLEASKPPSEVVREYYNAVTGFSQNTERAYDYLSSDVQAENEYLAYDETIRSTKSSLNSQGATVELVQIETLNQTEETATVEVVQRLRFAGAVNNEKINVTVIKEDGEWRIDEVFDPFSG